MGEPVPDRAPDPPDEGAGALSATFERDWHGLEPAARRCLELAYASLVADGLACGAVLTDASGAVVAEGRNRAYDPPGGTDVLQRTPLAHAEMNVLAAMPTDRDLSACTLWSSQEPCSMCTAAAAFTGVGTVRYVAPDPWALAAGLSRSARGEEAGSNVGPAEDGRWIVAANVMFMLSIARQRGLDHPTIVRNAELEPATTAIVRDLVETAAGLPASAETFLSDSWSAICQAAPARA